MKAPKPSAADYLPATLNLASLRRAAAGCQGCPLYKHATQTVFGEGPRRSQLMIIGEVPGDQEDLSGKPFVGPAGKLLDQALDQAGIRRADVYLTNAVKHFKFEQRGKRRLHKKPNRVEIVACHAWLRAEISVIQPAVIACLGATAAQSLLGANFRVTRQRGELIHSEWAPWTIATWHPSAVLRAPDADTRMAMHEQLTADLILAAQQIKEANY